MTSFDKAITYDSLAHIPSYRFGRATRLVFPMVLVFELLIGVACIVFPPFLMPGVIVGLFVFIVFFQKPEYSYYFFVFLLPFWDISLIQMGWIDVRPADLGVIAMVLTFSLNLVLRKDVHFQPTALGIPIVAFSFWAFASIAWGSFSAAAVPLVHFAYGLAIYFMTVNIVSDIKALRGATAVWIIAGVISAMIACYEFTLAPTESFTRFGQIRSSAFFVGKNRLGNFLMICILLTLGRTIIAKSNTRRYLFITAMGIMFTGLLTTLSRTAFAGLALGVVYFSYHSKRLRKPLVVSLVAFVTVALVISKGQVIFLFFERFFSIFGGLSEISAKRVASWKDALDMFFLSPIVGIGFGEYTKVIAATAKELSLLKVHNVYLAVLSELGLVGFMIFSAMLASIFLFVKKTMKIVKQDYRCYQISLAATGGLIAYLLCTLSQAIYVQERGTWAFLGLSMAGLMACRQRVVSGFEEPAPGGSDSVSESALSDSA
jgi:uncharacterized membrane protein